MGVSFVPFLVSQEIPVWVGAGCLTSISFYYKGTPVSEEELACKDIIDYLPTDNSTWGAR